jgi:hypothetical protein
MAAVATQEDWEGGTCLPEELQSLLDCLKRKTRPGTPLFIESGDGDEVRMDSDHCSGPLDSVV